MYAPGIGERCERLGMRCGAHMSTTWRMGERRGMRQQMGPSYYSDRGTRGSWAKRPLRVTRLLFYLSLFSRFEIKFDFHIQIK
jgi:hypothetical protein